MLSIILCGLHARKNIKHAVEKLQRLVEFRERELYLGPIQSQFGLVCAGFAKVT